MRGKSWTPYTLACVATCGALYAILFLDIGPTWLLKGMFWVEVVLWALAPNQFSFLVERLRELQITPGTAEWQQGLVDASLFLLGAVPLALLLGKGLNAIQRRKGPWAATAAYVVLSLALEPFGYIRFIRFIFWF